MDMVTTNISVSSVVFIRNFLIIGSPRKRSDVSSKSIRIWAARWFELCLYQNVTTQCPSTLPFYIP